MQISLPFASVPQVSVVGQQRFVPLPQKVSLKPQETPIVPAAHPPGFEESQPFAQQTKLPAEFLQAKRPLSVQALPLGGGVTGVIGVTGGDATAQPED
jgi:hypothetical protein